VIWNRSNTIGMALPSCGFCEGTGMCDLRHGKATRPCDCVFRNIFRACYQTFKTCAESGQAFGTISWDFVPGGGRNRMYSRKREEFLADFCLVAKRVLTPSDYKTMVWYFLEGATWQECCGRLGMSRGNFFHTVYRIERVAGKAFAETEPYALFPGYAYFSDAKVSQLRLDPPVRCQQWELAAA
jgi:hypothetical protein